MEPTAPEAEESSDSLTAAMVALVERYGWRAVHNTLYKDLFGMRTVKGTEREEDLADLQWPPNSKDSGSSEGQPTLQPGDPGYMTPEELEDAWQTICEVSEDGEEEG